MADLVNFIDKWCASKGYPKDICGLLDEANSELASIELTGQRNIFQHNGKMLLLDTIFEIYNIRKLSFKVDFDFDEFQLKIWGNSSVFLNLHGYFFPILRWYTDTNLKLAILSDYPAAIQLNARASGVTRGEVFYFKRDNLSLLKMKDFIKKNISVSATIDFRKSTYKTYCFLSDSLIRSVSYFGCPCYFVMPSLTDQNKIAPKLLKLDSALSLSQRKDLIIDFVTTENPGSDYKFEKFNYKKRLFELTSQ